MAALSSVWSSSSKPPNRWMAGEEGAELPRSTGCRSIIAGPAPSRVCGGSTPGRCRQAQAEPSGALRRATTRTTSHPRGPETRAQRGLASLERPRR